MSFGLAAAAVSALALEGAAATAMTIGVTAGVGALAGAGLGAGTAALTGGDVGKGALMGGVTGLVGGGLGAGIGAMGGLGGGVLGGAGTGLIAGAAGGAAGSAVGGEDVGKGALLGGAVGGLGGALTGGLSSAAAGEPADVAKTSISNSPKFQAATSPSGATAGALEPTIPTTNGIPSASNMSPMQVMQNETPIAGTGAMYPNAKIPINPLGSSGASAFNASTGIAPTSASSGISSAIESGTNFIKNNPAVAMQLGGAGLSMMSGNPNQQKAPASQAYPYSPSTYVPPAIQPTTVPQYYDPTGGYGYNPKFAEGGAVSNGQPNGQMNPIVARAIQQGTALAQVQQSQLPQQPPQPPAPQGIAAVTPPVQQPVQPIPQAQPTQMAAGGGMMRDNLGGYSHGGIAGLTRGPGDGVSDSIPAEIGTSGKQPARLADGEFVIPARIVSELGNGSTEAGAKSLQAMVDRVQARRGKTVGKGKVAVDSKARKGLLA